MPAATLVTLAQVFLDTSRYTGGLKNRGTATSVDTVSLTDNQSEQTPAVNDNVVRGTYLTLLDGANAGKYRQIQLFSSQFGRAKARTARTEQ